VALPRLIGQSRRVAPCWPANCRQINASQAIVCWLQSRPSNLIKARSMRSVVPKSKLLTTGMIGRCGRVISSFVIATIGSFQHSIFAVNIPMMHVGVMATPLLANLFSRFRFRSGTYRLSVVRSGRKTARSTHAPILVSSNLNQIGHTDSGTMRRRISGYAKASRNAALARPTANVGNMRRPSASMQLVRSRVCIW
jgi:hypothetical protein